MGVRWRRVYAGRYEAWFAARFERGGASFVAAVRAIVRHVEEWPAGFRWAEEAWLVHGIDRPDEVLIEQSDAPAPTRRDATESLLVSGASGWRWYSGCGFSAWTTGMAA